MEFGSPPLYTVVNQVARKLDYEYLDTLGPYMQVLNTICTAAEHFRLEGDKMTIGKQIHDSQCGALANIGGIFMMWRGIHVQPSDLKPWLDKTGQLVCMPSIASCS